MVLRGCGVKSVWCEEGVVLRGCGVERVWY